MKRMLFLSLVLPLMFVGCATSHKMNYVSLGMTKQEVITALGRPSSISAQGGTEYLMYRFSETDNHAINGITSLFFVRLISGKVESYGRQGDFDSTKDPKQKIDLSIEQKK